MLAPAPMEVTPGTFDWLMQRLEDATNYLRRSTYHQWADHPVFVLTVTNPTARREVEIRILSYLQAKYMMDASSFKPLESQPTRFSYFTFPRFTIMLHDINDK